MMSTTNTLETLWNTVDTLRKIAARCEDPSDRLTLWNLAVDCTNVALAILDEQIKPFLDSEA